MKCPSALRPEFLKHRSGEGIRCILSPFCLTEKGGVVVEDNAFPEVVVGGIPDTGRRHLLIV